jgi:serine/threonine protein kinase
MFTDAHLHELQPVDWNTEEHVLGKGSYGVVYKATWRSQPVAVKQLLLPEEPASERDEAREDRKRRVQAITRDFVTEVEVCCDLAHPNLVRLLGYSTKDGLLMVQELMLGQALDKQLYVERWRPSEHQIKRAAIDIAQGMRYLHSAFKDAAGQDKPIIHRDLKSPNLLLAQSPGRGPNAEVTVKISDFGLSREKEKTQEVGTVMMTGCGSVLWMAPEIMRGRKYNEKIDVFSYAMCLIELVDCNLPWTGIATSMEVPNIVTKGRRPDLQLSMATDQMRGLIRRCWDEAPSSRPSFTDIVEELTGERAEPVVARSAPPGASRLLQQSGSLMGVLEDAEEGSDSFDSLGDAKQNSARLREQTRALEDERRRAQEQAKALEQEWQQAERSLHQSQKEVETLRRQVAELRKKNLELSSGKHGESPRRTEYKQKVGASRPASPGDI